MYIPRVLINLVMSYSLSCLNNDENRQYNFYKMRKKKMKTIVRFLMKLVGIREYEEPAPHTCPSIPQVPLTPAEPTHKYKDGDIVIKSSRLEFPNGAILWIE